MQRNDAGSWSAYVRDHLLDRIFGFELMMAPYAVAHFKLALELAGYDLDLPEEQKKRWAYDFQADDRIRVYLTNALEVLPEDMPGLYGPMRFVAAEAKAADEVKQEKPIMVVLGNPPYSGHSSNDNPWIDGLLKGKLPDGTIVDSYYEVDGQPLGERNPKWLQDDYVKFIRFGQWRVDQTGSGVLAYITNHAYLDNPTFRGMRNSLMNSFSEIYILNLHGSSRKNELGPSDEIDENVFDIQQGVVITILIKNQSNNRKARVYYYDLWGNRTTKYQSLWNETVKTIINNEIYPISPFYLFIPQDRDISIEYNDFWSVTNIFNEFTSTITTARNFFSVAFQPDTLIQRIQDLQNDSIPDKKIREKYNLKDVSYWKLSDARDEVKEINSIDSYIEQYCYRPFDFRFVYYHQSVCERLRDEVMKHVKNHKNISLLTHRPQSPGEFSFIYATFLLGDQCVAANKSVGGGNSFQFPLYLYPDPQMLFDDTNTSPWPQDINNEGRVPNLNSDFISSLENKVGLAFNPLSENQELEDYNQFSPFDVLSYIYAVMHCPTYRKRYSESLKIDFPRVPLASDPQLFRRLVSLGRELLALHLMESPRLTDPMTNFPIPGDNIVAPRGNFPKYTPPEGEAGGKVFINNEQYFEGVPKEVWEFEISGYQVLHKWLKDRRGRELNYDDLEHYQKVVVALSETIRLMAEIDAAIPSWPVE